MSVELAKGSLATHVAAGMEVSPTLSDYDLTREDVLT